MRRITWLAPVLALLLVGCGTRTEPQDVAHPALWAVKDADTTIYLFGTVHMLPADLRWFEGGVKQAFDKSGTLVMELVMPSDAEMQALVQELGMDPAGPSLPDQLPQAEADKFRAALADAGQPAGALDHAEPWLAATVLSSLPLRKLGYDDKTGAETVLSDAAKAAGKPVVGLETARQQLGYFDTLPLPAQRTMLVETIDDLPEAGATVNRMVAAWRKGDADGLAAVMNEDMDRSPELEQALLVNRNRRWADWIGRRMKQPGTVFVAVGAGHLAGGESVQAELAKRGLKVARVPN
jgi:uncharacterized protein